MSRIARVVIPNCSHHIIQRGNRRLRAFFSEGDRELYCRLLRQEADKSGIIFWAYCLMDNHVHLVGIPQHPWSFARGIGEAHRKYTNAVNIRENWQGFLWQGRFLSYPLDESGLYRVIRYVERNPVRAGIVEYAEQYPWSSARAHVLGTQDRLVSDVGFPLLIHDWAGYLREVDDESDIRRLREHEKTGRPMGNTAFISSLEKATGRVLAPQKRGRKRARLSSCPELNRLEKR
jgi:putative transposase